MNIIIMRDTNLVFSQVRATTLILLNYKYSPTRHLGVNASIRPHSTFGVGKSVIELTLSAQSKSRSHVLRGKEKNFCQDGKPNSYKNKLKGRKR